MAQFVSRLVLGIVQKMAFITPNYSYFFTFTSQNPLFFFENENMEKHG